MRYLLQGQAGTSSRIFLYVNPRGDAHATGVFSCYFSSPAILSAALRV